MRAAAKKIEQGKVDHAELLAQKQHAILQDQRISEKDALISSMRLQHDLITMTMTKYEHVIANDSTIQITQQKEIKSLTRQVKTQKWKTRGAVLLGIVATGLSLYLSH